MSEVNLVTNTLKEDLTQFTGTENWYKYLNIVITDGIQFLAESAQCYWLIDVVASVQYLPKLRNAEFQVWKLEKNESNSKAIVKCDDGNGVKLYSQKIEYTDFSLPEIKLYFCNKVLMLTSEY